MLSPRLQLLLESLQKLLRRDALGHVTRLLKRARPADVAVVLRFINDRHLMRVFELLPDDAARAETLTELDDHLVTAVLEGRSAEELKRLIDQMSGDDQADVLSTLPDELQRQVIELLRPDDAEEVEELLHFDPETAGGIMSPDFFALSEQTTCAEAIEALRSTDDAVEMAFYIYVVNDQGYLVGVVSLRALVVNPASRPLCEIMGPDIIFATVTTDQEEVARMAARYNLLAVPVVDDNHHLVGIVTIDDVIDVIREEATEDMLMMTGADESAFEGYSVIKNFRTRAPWLFVTFLAGLVAGAITGAFELEKQVVLASFIPIVLGMGGNVGAQTATIIVRGLATGQVNARVGTRYLMRETGVGVLMGLLYGTLLGIYAMVAYDMGEVHQLALTGGLSILLITTMSALIGSVTPLIFDKLHIDPAVATGPVVTTTVDVLGVFTFFSIATVFMSGM